MTFKPFKTSKIPLYVALAVASAFVLWSASVALADAPQPNPLAQVAGVDLSAAGPAATVHGYPARGRALFAENCAPCHGALGVGGVANPGSSDGTVPALNPIDPGFIADSHGDPGAFAHDIDLFVQHGSRPAGSNPAVTMTAWGDKNLLTQQQLADIEAYMMELNGVYWTDRWDPPAEVQMTASQDGGLITYQIMVVNHGLALPSFDVRDTLPQGLTYVSSYLTGPGQNPGHWANGTVSWTNTGGIPEGGSVGPFVIVAKANGATVPANDAQVAFRWTSWDGTILNSTAVSALVAPQTAMARVPAAQQQPAAPEAASAAPAANQSSDQNAEEAAESAPQQPAAALAPAAAAAPVDVSAGKAVFAANCAVCHGQNAQGLIGPDLRHIGSQKTSDALTAFINDPGSVDPGSAMPKLGLNPADLNAVVAYLMTLK